MRLLKALILMCVVLIAGCAREKSQDVREKSQKSQVQSLDGKLITLDLSGVLLKMIKVKAGRFQMGSPDGELGGIVNGGRRLEKTHWVTLTQDYWLGETEVTQGQWKAVIGDNPSIFKKGYDNPVENVSWDDAMEFCSKLNRQFKEKLPEGYEFSLPTEAQWEYACRAGTTTALNNGKDLTSEDDECANLDEVGWYKENSGSSTHPVAQKKPNAWGFYDMHGNVYEWCSDWYDGGYGCNERDAMDPQGPQNGLYRVQRGGSWCNFARDCRAAFRISCSPSCRGLILGFRVALVPVKVGGKGPERAQKQTLLEKIKQRGRIIVYTNPEFEPYEYLDKNGKIIGAEIDIVNRIARKLGVKAEIVNTEFDTILMAVVEGKADIGASGFTITEVRRKRVDFSKPFVVIRQNLIVPESSGIKVVEDLAGKRIGGQQGTTGLMMIEDAVSKGVLKGKNTEVKAYNNAPDAVIALKSGKLDAVVIDELVARLLTSRNSGLKCFEMLKTDGKCLEPPEEFGIMLPKGNDDLLAIINEVIDEMMADGSWEASVKVHFDAFLAQ